MFLLKSEDYTADHPHHHPPPSPSLAFFCPAVVFLGADSAHPEVQTLMCVSADSPKPMALLSSDSVVAHTTHRKISKEEELLRE